MKIVFHFLVVAILCSFAQASVITFEDLTPADQYYVGDTFTSGGVKMTGAEFFWLPSGSTTSGFAAVINPVPTNAGGTGNEIWLNNINLDFDLSYAAIEGLSLQYGNSGGNVNLEINGMFHNANDFSALNGTMFGGVMVSIVDGIDGKGAIFATGPIHTFSIGGQELAIDNVIACIPEPATLSLLALGGLCLRRKRR